MSQSFEDPNLPANYARCGEDLYSVFDEFPDVVTCLEVGSADYQRITPGTEIELIRYGRVLRTAKVASVSKKRNLVTIVKA